jgi:hypothetical protein
MIAMYKSNRVNIAVFGSAFMVSILLAAGTITEPAFAHQRQLFTIGGQDYLVIIGSLNEPIFVDDKTGVDFRILNADPNDPMNSRAEGATPVEGLEETLQVEIGAGDKKKVMELEPAFRDPGAYRAHFYPTVATTLTYRIFGTINDTPVDLTFTCSPAGEAGAAPSNTTEQISEGVVRKGIAGGYGCPAPRSDAGFPEPYTSNNEMASSLQQIQADVSSIRSSVGPASSSGIEWAGLGAGIAGIGIAVAAIAMSRNRKRTAA